MSQMAAMKMLDFYQKRLTVQEIMMHLPIVAFPLFLQTRYIRNNYNGSLKSFMF